MVKSNNWKESEWEEKESLETNAKKVGSREIKHKVVTYEKVDKFPTHMNIDSMINKIQSKNLISIPKNDFPAINQLIVLRNKVHLQINDDEEHDYNSFDYVDIQKMRRILYIALTAKEISSNPKVFSFISKAYNR